MTLRSLEYFLVVVKHLNISRAAQELYISQPALSKQIRLLEEELQVVLFDRGNHSLTLTPAGETLLSEANELFAKHTQLVNRVRAAALSTPDTLHIHHMSGSFNHQLPDWILSFQEENKNITVQIDRSSPSQIFSDLLNDKIQVGFLLSAATSCPNPLQTITLHQDQLALAVPKHHPLAHKTAIRFSEIVNETLLLLESQDAPFQHSLLPFFLYMNRGQSKNRIHYLKDMETIVALARAGSGLSFIASDYCMNTRDLHLIPISDAFPIRLCMTWNPYSMNKNTELFIQYIKEKAPDAFGSNQGTVKS